MNCTLSVHHLSVPSRFVVQEWKIKIKCSEFKLGTYVSHGKCDRGCHFKVKRSKVKVTRHHKAQARKALKLLSGSLIILFPKLARTKMPLGNNWQSSTVEKS